MTFVSPHLITAHAPLISAPHHSAGNNGASSAAAAGVPGPTALHLAALAARQRRDGDGESDVVQQKRPMISVGVTKADIFGKDIPGSRREVARIAPGGGMGVSARASAQEMYDYKLSSEPKMELSRINSELENARKSRRFSDDEMAELERQAMAKRIGIKPLPMPKEEQPVPTFHTDNHGREWVMQGNAWEPVDALVNRGQKQRDDFAEIAKLVPDTKTVMQKNEASGKMEPVEVPLSMDEKLKAMEDMRQMRDRFNARQIGGEERAPGSVSITPSDPVVAARGVGDGLMLSNLGLYDPGMEAL
ncbi:MAG: hypothetical protein IKO55_01645, partial [Kiritimatiellae bacterium]|nr:hypothetical protein [Kiritimatiellia bacterium]